MRIVGNKSSRLGHLPATPSEAWSRGRALDAMLAPRIQHEPSVLRLTHAQRNALDDARMVDAARRIAQGLNSQE